MVLERGRTEHNAHVQLSPRLKERLVAYNELGRRIGATHHRAVHDDETIEMIRELNEHEDPEKRMGYRRLAKMFGLSIPTVRDICTYKMRGQTPREWRREVMP